MSSQSNNRANVARATRTRPSKNLCNTPCFKTELVARLRADMPADEQVDELRGTFSGLADCTRLKILHALRTGEELCVCDVAHVLGMSVSAASHHLRKLRELKILQYRNDGKMAYYSLRDRLAADLVGQALRNIKP